MIVAQVQNKYETMMMLLNQNRLKETFKRTRENESSSRSRFRSRNNSVKKRIHIFVCSCILLAIIGVTRALISSSPKITQEQLIRLNNNNNENQAALKSLNSPLHSTSSSSSITSTQDYHNSFAKQQQHSNSLLSDGLRLLRRRRRQASSSQAQTNQQVPAGSTNQAGGDNTQDIGAGSNSGDQPELPEVLQSLKCDFGSAEAPDMCKFRILTNEPDSLAKTASAALLSGTTSSRFSSSSSWALGSGRLALFQGGPLMDATGLQAGSNDTSGGYIFYETSNPSAGSTIPSAPAPLSNNSALMTHPNDYLAPYATTTTLGNNKHRPQNANQFGLNASPPLNQYHDQIISSHRVSVATPVALQQQQQQQQQQPLVGSNNLASSSPFAGPSFMSANLSAPGPSGMCLSFQYAIQGLSAEELRVYLSDQKTGRSRQLWSSSESAASNWTRGEVLYSVTNQHSLVFSAVSSSAIASSTRDLQQRKFRGYLALDDIEVQRHDATGGDQAAACRGHCNFDGDLCGWTNGENGQEDDFDWSFGRGSDNLFTGPARDFTSSTNNEPTGSFLFTDSGYPRRPGDRASLISPMFQPTAMNDAMCMRFAVHMFGSGIGSLAIKLRYADEGGGAPPENQPGEGGGAPRAGPQSSSATGASSSSSSASLNNLAYTSTGGRGSSSTDGKQADLVVWEMSGDAGNVWHQAQTSVSSARSQFQVIIEGVIGENHLGNIALDEIAFSQGPCPTSPPVASKNYGDCTFEQSMCYWRNPDADIHLDDLDWVRQADETSIHGPNFDHTLKKRSGSYLKLENTFIEPKSGTRAFLLSPVFQPKASGSVQCLSFYYYMFMRTISSSGPNLGTIRVYLASNNELVPIWRLTNPISSPNWKHGRASLSTAIVDGQPQAPSKLFQIAFEGIWGDAPSGAIALDDITVFDGACDLMPAEARSVPGECSFDVDMCSWSNKSASFALAPNGQLAALVSDDPSSSLAVGSGGGIGMFDSSRSPFLQSVGGTIGHHHHQSSTSGQSSLGTNNGQLTKSWQLATVDSRPVNLQDHTYKAPIGYAYLDVLDSAGPATSTGSSGPSTLAYPLQSAEVTVQSGQQLVQCLSFWFAAFGRGQDTNQLSVYLTQASAPPAPPEDGGGGGGGGGSTSVVAPTRGSQTSNNGASGAAAGSSSTSSDAATAAAEAEQANAWKAINGKLLWNMALKNVSESQRRKWIYAQVTIRADSNHIVRFLAISNDGGFALDDVSYFEGACETRPSLARVQSAEDEAADFAAGANGQGGGGANGGGQSGSGAGGANSSGGNSAGGGLNSATGSSGSSGSGTQSSSGSSVIG